MQPLIRKIFISGALILSFVSCTDPAPEGNKYYLLLHLEKQEPMGTRYLPITRKDSIIAISDSAAYMYGAANLLSIEQNLQRMKAEGLGVYERVKGFSVTNSAGNDIKPNLKPVYIQRIDRFIEKRRGENWMSTIEKE